jgi:hypothetical protein
MALSLSLHTGTSSWGGSVCVFFLFCYTTSFISQYTTSFISQCVLLGILSGVFLVIGYWFLLLDNNHHHTTTIPPPTNHYYNYYQLNTFLLRSEDSTILTLQNNCFFGNDYEPFGMISVQSTASLQNVTNNFGARDDDNLACQFIYVHQGSGAGADGHECIEFDLTECPRVGVDAPPVQQQQQPPPPASSSSLSAATPRQQQQRLIFTTAMMVGLAVVGN